MIATLLRKTGALDARTYETEKDPVGKDLESGDMVGQEHRKLIRDRVGDPGDTNWLYDRSIHMNDYDFSNEHWEALEIESRPSFSNADSQENE